MKGVLTTLNTHRLGSINHFVIYFMGSLMAIDQKVYWYTESNARRTLSIMLSKEYNSNPNLQRSYPTIGAYRKYLETNNLVKICPSTELDFKVTLKQP